MSKITTVVISRNATTRMRLDTAVLVQAEFLPQSRGLHGIIIIGQTHLQSILPLVHIQNPRWRLEFLVPSCNTATVLEHPLQCTKAHVHLRTGVVTSLCFLSVILSPCPVPHCQLGKTHVSTLCCLPPLSKWKAENSIGKAKAGKVKAGKVTIGEKLLVGQWTGGQSECGRELSDALV